MNDPRRNGGARAIADLQQGTILATVEIAAPPARVFEALTRPEEITRWWGSAETYRTTGWESDLRVGGTWRSRGQSADGSTFTVGGEFLEVAPPHTLAFTWRPDWDAGNVTTVRYRLDPIEGGTRLTLRHDGFAGRPETCRDHTSGWELVLNWMAQHVAPAPADAALHFLLRLIPPRPTFPVDMSAAEAATMQQHFAYWSGLLARGNVLVFGPVADPKGAWGVGVVRVEGEPQLAELCDNDPAIRSGVGFRYEALPMPRALSRG